VGVGLGRRVLAKPHDGAFDVPVHVGQELLHVPGRRARRWAGEILLGQLQGGLGDAFAFDLERVERLGHPHGDTLWRSRSCRAITIFWISLVPSPISRNGASRYRRSIVYSFE